MAKNGNDEKTAFHIFLIATIYFVTARLGLLLAYPGTNATPLWAPTGISLASVLLLGYRIWPGIALGAFAVNFVLLTDLNLSLPASFAASLMTSTGNTLEALTGVFLIRRFAGPDNPFERTSNVIRFIILGAIISTTVSATIGTISFSLTAGEWEDFGRIWLTWWLGNSAGAIIITPLVMTYSRSEFIGQASRPKIVKHILIVIFLLAAWYVVFEADYPLSFILIPVLIFSAYYLDQFGSAIVICLISVFATVSTINDSGPFASYSLNVSLLLQQGFIGSVAIATMVLASLVSEQKKSEYILREKDRYNRTLFESALIGLALSRMNGSLVDVNGAFAKIIGRTVEETLSLTNWDITPEKYTEQEQQQLQSLRTTGSYGPYEKDYKHKNGHLVPVRLQGTIVKRDGEDLIWSSVEDITGRKQAEKLLMQSEQKYRELVENANSIILRWSRDGRITFMNEFGQRFFGYSEAEIIGRHVVGTIVPERESTGRDLRPLMDEICADPKKFEHNINENMRRSGELVWIAWTNKVILDEQGQIKEILSIGSDITELKRAEEEIRTINEELLSINRIVTAIATTTGVKFILETILDEALNITGLEGGTICLVTADETLQLAAHRGTSEATILDLTTNEVKVGDCLCGECARDHKPLVLPDREAVLKYASREATRNEDIRFHAAFPLIIGERCLGVLCVFTRTDIKPAERRLKLLETVTAQIAIAVDNARMFEEISHHAALLENKVLERTRDLQAANEKLKELDRLKSMFIASMSHELRTPLNSIIGFTGIILQGMSGDLNDRQKDQLQRVYSAAKHLLSLITDVIDISKIEAGKIEAYPETFVLKELIDEAVSSLKTEIDRKGLTVNTGIPQDLTLTADRKRLLQCMLNYMSNAVKFTEKGTISIEAKENRGMVDISVTDPGIGIKEEDVPRLFQSFVRLDSHLKTIVPGTGLGLYLTKKLATEVLGGTVSAESVYGTGSVFSIRVLKETGKREAENIST